MPGAHLVRFSLPGLQFPRADHVVPRAGHPHGTPQLALAFEPERFVRVLWLVYLPPARCTARSRCFPASRHALFHGRLLRCSGVRDCPASHLTRACAARERRSSRPRASRCTSWTASATPCSPSARRSPTSSPVGTLASAFLAVALLLCCLIFVEGVRFPAALHIALVAACLLLSVLPVVPRRQAGQAEQPAQGRAAHGRRGAQRQVGPPLPARKGLWRS